MSGLLRGKSILFFLTLLLLFTTKPLYAHVMTTGISRWCFGNDYVLVQIDLDSYLIGVIKGIREGGNNPDAIDEKQLPKIAAEILQPYINERLHLTVNNKPCPLKVIKVVRSQELLFTVCLYADNIVLNKPEVPVKIEYRLLFPETSYAHQNMAYMYTADGPSDTVQKIFDNYPPKWQAIFDPSAPEWEVLIKR